MVRSLNCRYKLTMPAFHLIGVAVTSLEPSSGKLKVFVSIVFSK